jgi:hypothetical protein
MTPFSRGILMLFSGVLFATSIILLVSPPSPADAYLQVLVWGLFVVVMVINLFDFLARRRNRRFIAQNPVDSYTLDEQDRLHYRVRPIELRGYDAPELGDARDVATIALDRVGYVSWFALQDVPEIDGHYVFFWDRDPKLEMTLFGPQPTIDDAEQLGVVHLPSLQKDAPVLDRIVTVLDPRVASGDCVMNLDLRTSKQVPGTLPPLAAGLTMKGRRIVPVTTITEQ